MKKDALIEKINSFISTIFETEVPAVEIPKVEMIQSTLEDGKIVEYSALEVDQPIVEVLPDGNVPLVDGEYMIEGNKVTVVAGVITAVQAEEAKTVEVEVPLEQKEEKVDLKAQYDAQILALKADYEVKLLAEKTRITKELEKLVNEVSLSKLIQAPVEVELKALTPKEIMLKELEEKRKAKKG